MSRWENIGDKYLLNALGGDVFAAQQSVAMYLDPIAKCIEWHTNGHVIRLRPDLPSAIISGPFATSFGYEWNLAGGLVFGIGDVSLTKRAGILDTFGLQGVQIYYIVPVGQIPDIPIIKIEKIDILDGMIEQLDLAPQGVLSAEDIADGHSRTAPWVDHGMPLYWKDKINNNLSDARGSYMNGKVLQKAPPLAHPLVCADLQAGNAGNRSFAAAGGSETIGEYEVLLGGFQKTFKRQDLIDGRGVGTHYAFAATLGYTAEPGSYFNGYNATSARFNGGFNGVGAITLDSVVFWTNTNASGFTAAGAVYDENGTPAPVNLKGATGNHSIGTISGATAVTIPAVGTPAMTLTPGTDYTMGAIARLAASPSALCATGYDTPLTGVNYRLNTPYNFTTETWVATSPTVQTTYNDTFRWGVYINYTAAGGGGIIPQIMHNRQLQRRR